MDDPKFNAEQERRNRIEDIASPDAPTTINEFGGSQSDIPVRFDLIDANAMFEMAKVLDHGARKYGEDNWRLISVRDHLNHLLMHTFAYLAGDDSDEHLSHILCRATFAQGVALQGVTEDLSYICEYCGEKDIHRQDCALVTNRVLAKMYNHKHSGMDAKD